jgi:hypothetical protein
MFREPYFVFLTPFSSTSKPSIWAFLARHPFAVDSEPLAGYYDAVLGEVMLGISIGNDQPFAKLLHDIPIEMP